MALNRAQLLAGNSLNGPVIAGEPQGIIAGSGVSISPTGVISLDASTLTTVIKTNNTSAFNGYIWPASDGSVGTVLTTDGAGNLSWTPSSGTPGLGITLSGSALKVSIPVSNVPPSPGTGIAESVDGSLYWDRNLGILFIRYNDGTTTQWVQVTPSAGSSPVTSVNAGTGISVSSTTGSPVITNTGVVTITGGTGILASASSGSVTLTNSGVTSLTAGPNITLSGSQGAVTISSSSTGTITGVTAGSGLSGGGSSGNVTLVNTGVTSVAAGTGISISSTTGGVTITNSGVTSVTGSLPLAITGSLNSPNVSINLGLGTVLSGDFVKSIIPIASTPPSQGIGQSQSTNGSQYWDNDLGASFVLYNDGSTTQWVQATPSVGSSPVTSVNPGTGISVSSTTGSPIITNTGVVTITGGTGITASASSGSITLTNSGVTSLTAGPNISLSGTQGAVTISSTGSITGVTAGSGLSGGGSSGNVTLVNTGVTSVAAGTGISVSNTTGGVTITNSGVTSVTSSLPLSVAGSPDTPNISLNLGLGTVLNGNFLKSVIPIATTPPSKGTGQLQSISGSQYWDNDLGALFILYDDGSTTQWVQVAPVTSGASGSFVSQDGKTVSVVNGLIVSII